MSNLENSSQEKRDTMTDLEKMSLWGKIKEWIHIKKKSVYRKEGQICWINFGQNIGSETYGKGDYFTRPALVLKKYFGKSAVIIPLTSKKKEGFLYRKIIDVNGGVHYALLYQIRYIDGKRINKKVSSISKDEMKSLKLQLSEVLGLL